jgi:hypothetical protein
MAKKQDKKRFLLIGVIVLIVVVLGIIGYFYYFGNGVMFAPPSTQPTTQPANPCAGVLNPPDPNDPMFHPAQSDCLTKCDEQNKKCTDCVHGTFISRLTEISNAFYDTAKTCAKQYGCYGTKGCIINEKYELYPDKCTGLGCDDPKLFDKCMKEPKSIAKEAIRIALIQKESNLQQCNVNNDICKAYCRGLGLPQ